MKIEPESSPEPDQRRPEVKSALEWDDDGSELSSCRGVSLDGDKGDLDEDGDNAGSELNPADSNGVCGAAHTKKEDVRSARNSQRSGSSSRSSDAEEDEDEDEDARKRRRAEAKAARDKKRRKLRAYTALLDAPPLPPPLELPPLPDTPLLCRTWGGQWPTWPARSLDVNALDDEQKALFAEAQEDNHNGGGGGRGDGVGAGDADCADDDTDEELYPVMFFDVGEEKFGWAPLHELYPYPLPTSATPIKRKSSFASLLPKSPSSPALVLARALDAALDLDLDLDPRLDRRATMLKQRNSSIADADAWCRVMGLLAAPSTAAGDSKRAGGSRANPLSSSHSKPATLSHSRRRRGRSRGGGGGGSIRGRGAGPASARGNAGNPTARSRGHRRSGGSSNGGQSKFWTLEEVTSSSALSEIDQGEDDESSSVEHVDTKSEQVLSTQEVDRTDSSVLSRDTPGVSTDSPVLSRDTPTARIDSPVLSRYTFPVRTDSPMVSCDTSAAGRSRSHSSSEDSASDDEEDTEYRSSSRAKTQQREGVRGRGRGRGQPRPRASVSRSISTSSHSTPLPTPLPTPPPPDPAPPAIPTVIWSTETCPTVDSGLFLPLSSRPPSLSGSLPQSQSEQEPEARQSHNRKRPRGNGWTRTARGRSRKRNVGDADEERENDAGEGKREGNRDGDGGGGNRESVHQTLPGMQGNVDSSIGVGSELAGIKLNGNSTGPVPGSGVPGNGFAFSDDSEVIYEELMDVLDEDDSTVLHEAIAQIGVVSSAVPKEPADEAGEEADGVTGGGGALLVQKRRKRVPNGRDCDTEEEAGSIVHKRQRHFLNLAPEELDSDAQFSQHHMLWSSEQIEIGAQDAPNVHSRSPQAAPSLSWCNREAARASAKLRLVPVPVEVQEVNNNVVRDGSGSSRATARQRAAFGADSAMDVLDGSTSTMCQDETEPPTLLRNEEKSCIRELYSKKLRSAALQLPTIDRVESVSISEPDTLRASVAASTSPDVTTLTTPATPEQNIKAQVARILGDLKLVTTDLTRLENMVKDMERKVRTL
ncbi:hypothetical protein HDU93_000852 [Gonapodya sp. JEL0774]|nr:hypothetical protein HDU93_000852 [Gonapodya sp. JEL0774]